MWHDGSFIYEQQEIPDLFASWLLYVLLSFRYLFLEVLEIYVKNYRCLKIQNC